MKARMNEQRFQEWHRTATQDEIKLLERVEEFATHFEDMIFSNGTSTHDFIACKRGVMNGLAMRLTSLKKLSISHTHTSHTM